MSTKKQREKAEKANVEDEASKNTGQDSNEKMSIQTFDKYQCFGNVKVDFPRLCALLDIKDIPTVSNRQQRLSNSETEGCGTGGSQPKINDASDWSKPRLHVEQGHEDGLRLRIPGWKVDDKMVKVLHKMLPSLGKLESLSLWQAGLTDQTLLSLLNTIPLCSSLGSVELEGNPLPEQSFHLLLSVDSHLTQLSLRNNRIGDEGARLIGSALSTTRSANKNLLSLNLSFNSIGDVGAAHIAQGLRLNRTLRFLSLSNNWIGDAGAAHLAKMLSEFALSHEEVVERRKLLLERRLNSSADKFPSVPSNSSLSSSKDKKKEAQKKGENPSAAKENPKPNKKCTEVNQPQRKDDKLAGRDKQPPAQEEKSSTSPTEQMEETVNPLLDQSVQCRDGEVFLPGNTTLMLLNLAGNRITEKSLPLFLKALETQSARGGAGLLLRLQRNKFPPDCECHMKINEIMKSFNPLEKSNPELTEEEERGE